MGWVHWLKVKTIRHRERVTVIIFMLVINYKGRGNQRSDLFLVFFEFSLNEAFDCFVDF
jgi:hypothetical protein